MTLPATTKPLPLHQPRITRATWATMDLMKTFTHIDEELAQVFITEVRRDASTGLTLQHTHPLFHEPGMIHMESDVLPVVIIKLGSVVNPARLPTYNLHSDLLTDPPEWSMSWLMGAGMVLALVTIGLIVWA